jgi:hypothetical protein
MPETRYQIGRAFTRGPLYHSFDFVWKDGRAVIENEDKVLGPTSAEREVINRHLQMKLRALEGEPVEGGAGDAVALYEPGTERHFHVAAHQMPKPFGKMPI